MKDSLVPLEKEEAQKERSGEYPVITRRSILKKTIAGSITVLMGNLLDETAVQASIDREGRKDFIDMVEINIFGAEPVRTSVIYRDKDESIIDWRWYTTSKQIPRPLGDGRYIAIWEDQGSPRVIITPNAPRYRRTQEDVELQERAILPAERRRKLSN